MQIRSTYIFVVRGLVVGAAVILLAAAVITVDGMRDVVPDSDLAIVPGNAVTVAGKPSRRLQGRLDAAIDLYRKGRCKAVLVSGGIEENGLDEAQVMKSYLVEHGVASTDVYTDNSGKTTLDTAIFAANLIRSKGLGKPILVSQFFHISRLRLAMQRQGIEPNGSAHSRYYEPRDIYSTFREVFAYLLYAFK